MPNYRPKGREHMRELGRIGGKKSGIRRRMMSFIFRKAEDHMISEATGRQFSYRQIVEAMKPVNLSGGDHGTDWRCPQCLQFNSAKRQVCAHCYGFSEKSERLTRAALREREGKLRKHG